MKKSIWIIIIGIVLLAIDIKIPMGDRYPNMIFVEGFGKVFQQKVTTNFIGIRPVIDVMPDILGFLFIFVGTLMIIRGSWKFILAMLLAPAAIYLNVIIPLLPYHYQAKELYLKAAGYNFLVVAIEILIEYLVIHGIVTMTNCLQNKWNNNEMLGGWIIAMMSKGLLVGIDFFFGEGVFYYIYSLVLIGATVFYVNRLLKTIDYRPEVLLHDET